MSRRALQVLEVLLIALSVWQLGEVGLAMHARWSAPFDLEWMEGATLVAALRASQSLPLHGAPSPEYIPFIYPPLHAWLLGGLAQLFPLGHPLGRALSIACTLGAGGALYAAARGVGARPALSLACVGLFASCYAESGTFYDLVRTDALAMMLLGGSLALCVLPHPRAAIVGGMLLAVAFTAKHHSAAWGFPIALALWKRDGWRAAVRFAAASALPALAFLAWQQLASDGRFLAWLLEVPATHAMVARRALPSLSRAGEPQGAQWELWSALPITTTAALVALPAWRDRLYWGGAALVALLVCSLMRGHEGGYLNVLIPGFYLLALMPALLSSSADAVATDPPTSGARALLRWAPHCLVLLVAAQLLQGRDDLRRFLPSPADAQQHAALVDDVAALPGPVLIPHAPWLAVQAGHPPSVALIALWDIDHEGGPFLDGAADFREALAEGYWASAVMPDARIGRGFPQAYARASSVRVQSVPTRTGWNVRLKEVWMPRVADVPSRDPRPLEPATTSP